MAFKNPPSFRSNHTSVRRVASCQTQTTQVSSVPCQMESDTQGRSCSPSKEVTYIKTNLNPCSSTKSATHPSKIKRWWATRTLLACSCRAFLAETTKPSRKQDHRLHWITRARATQSVTSRRAKPVKCLSMRFKKALLKSCKCSRS